MGGEHGVHISPVIGDSNVATERYGLGEVMKFEFYYGIQPFKWYFEMQAQGLRLASVPKTYPAPARRVTFEGLDIVVERLTWILPGDQR